MLTFYFMKAGSPQPHISENSHTSYISFYIYSTDKAMVYIQNNYKHQGQ